MKCKLFVTLITLTILTLVALFFNPYYHVMGMRFPQQIDTQCLENYGDHCATTICAQYLATIHCSFGEVPHIIKATYGSSCEDSTRSCSKDVTPLARLIAKKNNLLQ